jgi:hypothetical protein
MAWARATERLQLVFSSAHKILPTRASCLFPPTSSVPEPHHVASRVDPLQELLLNHEAFLILRNNTAW